MRSRKLTELSEACKKLTEKTSRKREKGLRELRPLIRNKALCRELSDPQWLLVADLVFQTVETTSKSSKTEELRLFKDVLRQMFRNMNVIDIDKICTRFWTKALDILERTETETQTLAETLDVVQLLCEKKRCPKSRKQLENLMQLLIDIAEESRGGERNQIVLALRSLRAVRFLVSNHTSTAKVRSVLGIVMDFLEEWPSANNDIVINDTQLNREYVMACCVVLRRFPFGSISMTRRQNSLKWILRFWDFVSPESPSSDCIVEYFRLRIKNSSLVATSRNGESNLVLHADDNLQGSLLRIAFGLATRVKHLTYVSLL
jgi:hypothetical protein